MTTKRQVLELLNKSDLVEISQAYGYTAMGVLPKADLLNTLVRAKSVKLEEILDLFKIYELRSIADALGLNMGGNKKSDLIDRILGREAKKPVPKNKAKPKRARKSKPRSDKTTKKAPTDTTVVPLKPAVRTVAARTFTRKSDPKAIEATFDQDIIPQADIGVSPSTTNALQKEQEAIKKKEEEQDKAIEEREAKIKVQARTLEEREAKLEELDSELAQLRADLAEAKSRNLKVPDKHDYSEYETRKLIIDRLLREAGWTIDEDVSTE